MSMSPFGIAPVSPPSAPLPQAGLPTPLAVQAASTPFPSIASAKADGAVAGTVLSAPLAPATGPIEGEAESLVVVTVKNFFDSKTWKAIRAVLVSATALVALALMDTFVGVWTSGKSVFDTGAIDWRMTERACEIAAGLYIGSVVMAWARKYDNNAVKG